MELEETTHTIESLGHPDSDILSTPLWISNIMNASTGNQLP